MGKQLDELDKQSELGGFTAVGLTVVDYKLRYFLQNKLNNILREKDVKWMQRAKERDLLEGYSNTRYFMSRASGRKRKSKIFRLCQERRVIEGDENILNYATSFYEKALWPCRSINCFSCNSCSNTNSLIL